jgi:hypothetical protein
MCSFTLRDDIINHDIGAGLTQGVRHSAADTGIYTGDQRLLSGEQLARRFSYFHPASPEACREIEAGCRACAVRRPSPVISRAPQHEMSLGRVREG